MQLCKFSELCYSTYCTSFLWIQYNPIFSDCQYKI
nr:MAG TPA: hypothetical protein [Caudoviricetes sp.]